MQLEKQSQSILEPPHLLLVDGLNVVRRVHGAIKEEDEEIKAQQGLKKCWFSFYKALNEHAPTHFLTVFDGESTNWRHDLYPAYKTGRRSMPQALRDALPDFKEHMNAAGLFNVTAEGFEAEDTINTLALKAKARNYKVTVLSTDKDLCELTGKGVSVYNHFESCFHDAAWIQKKWGIEPNQVRDFLALWGDSVDGIPGVNGIGAKTAAKLLAQYGTLENVLAVAHEPGIKGELGKNLRDQADQARLAFRLICLSDNAPINVKPSELRLPPLSAIRKAQEEWLQKTATPARTMRP